MRMNYLRATAALVFCANPLLAQQMLWEKSYGGDKAEYLFDMVPTADNGFILAGSSLSQKTGNKNSAPAGDLDYWISKLDERGDPDWEKSFGGSGSDMLKSIRHTTDGGFILGGSSDSPKGGMKKDGCRGSSDYWIIKLNAKGAEQWQKTYGGKGQDDLTSIAPAKDGGYIVGGSSSSDASPDPQSGLIGISGEKRENSKGNMDYWILKLDKDGEIEWQKTYGGQYADLLRTLIPTADGGYLAGGWSNSPQSGDKDNVNYGIGGDYWILKLDKKGTIEWQQTIGGDKDDQMHALVQTYDKGYLLGGSSSSGASKSKNTSNGDGNDIWVLKLEESGIIQWQQTYDFGSNDMLTSIVENPDHSLMIAGYSRSSTKSTEGINDYIAFKISEKGDKLWEEVIGSEGEDILKKAVMTRDGGYILAGTSNPEKQPKGFSKNAKDKKGALTLGSGKNIAIADKAQKYVDETLKEGAAKVNDYIDKKMDAATEKLNKTINRNPDSRLKVGVSGPTGDLLNIAKGGGGNPLDAAGGLLSGMGNEGNKPASRSKKMNFGKGDFWIVKYGIKGKKTETETSIEAYPNPTQQFVNVVAGFDYTKGTIAVYNLGGMELQRFKVTGRTIPVDLGNYPEGMYIISVSTDNGEGSVKVIKAGNK